MATPSPRLLPSPGASPKYFRDRGGLRIPLPQVAPRPHQGPTSKPPWSTIYLSVVPYHVFRFTSDRSHNLVFGAVWPSCSCANKSSVKQAIKDLVDLGHTSWHELFTWGMGSRTMQHKIRKGKKPEEKRIKNNLLHVQGRCCLA